MYMYLCFFALQLFDFEITEEDMQIIHGLNINHRMNAVEKQ